MISVSLLIVAMILTYRPIEMGMFLTPGGVIPFSSTYVIAGIVSEVYSFRNAKRLIIGNFICIFVFNITMTLMLKIPTPNIANNEFYTAIFNNSLYTMLMYSFGFLLGDLINAFCISKWSILTNGKYFITRLIGASVIGQIFFSIVVIPMLYATNSDLHIFFRQFTTTILAKVLIIIILSYPGKIVKKLLIRAENINKSEQRIIFNPFSS